MTSGPLLLLAAALALLSPLVQQGGAKKGKSAPPPPKSHTTIGTADSAAKPPAATELKSPEEYFEACDYNGDGVISFNEANASLALDAASFQVYDADRDGLISLGEFKARYQSILDNGGAFPMPIAKAKSRKPPRRTPAELLAQYDKNDDQALDVREIKAALEDYQIGLLDPEMALDKLDKDGSKRLEIGELEEFANILSPASAAKRVKLAKSIDELFGKKVPREVREDTTLLPPQIVGPVSPFRRLDLDGSGGISAKDLNELQRPVMLSVRINAVVATLDVDHDGVISEKEFWESMTAPQR
jgi:Ca2+-binding EF-hand superfamily protein